MIICLEEHLYKGALNSCVCVCVSSTIICFRLGIALKIHCIDIDSSSSSTFYN